MESRIMLSFGLCHQTDQVSNSILQVSQVYDIVITPIVPNLKSVFSWNWQELTNNLMVVFKNAYQQFIAPSIDM